MVLIRGLGDDDVERRKNPRDKAFKLTDSHRLYLLVTPGGSKLRKWNYAYDGKQKTMAFGSYPVVGVPQAWIVGVMKAESGGRLTSIVVLSSAGRGRWG